VGVTVYAFVRDLMVARQPHEIVYDADERRLVLPAGGSPAGEESEE
jgi:hypothetical protein